MMNSTEKGERRIHGSTDNSLTTSTQTKPRSFFKLILSPTVQFTKLRIPEAFARAFSDELSGTAILTVPTGESWEVTLVTQDDQIWFCEGWQEFVDYFSISLAYFVLFLYEGPLKFKVHIFTPTACEITYPRNVNVATSVGASSGTNNSDMDLETLDSEDETPNKDVVSDVCGGRLSASEHEMEQDLDEGSIHSTNTKGTPRRNLWLHSKGMMQALAAVGISLPTNPFFVTLIKKYTLDKQLVNIPLYFTRDYLGREACKMVKLEASNGKQWSVKLRCDNRNDSYSFARGLLVFMREIKLKVGDVCVFELTDVQNRVLRVHVGLKPQLENQNRWALKELMKLS